jgi:hypothetical protein
MIAQMSEHTILTLPDALGGRFVFRGQRSRRDTFSSDSQRRWMME